jgi:hypothetical protein
MKARAFTCVCLFTVVAAGAYATRAGHLSQWWNVLANNGPLLDMPPRLELGEQQYGTIVISPFRVSNRGRAELTIDHIRSTCSCSGLERVDGDHFVRVEKLKIPPEGGVDLVVRMVVNGRVGGPHRSAISFDTNDAQHPSARLEVDIQKVAAGLQTSPSCVELGEVVLGQERRQTIELRDSAIGSRTIKQVSTSDADQIAVKLLPVETDHGNPDDHSFGVLKGRVEVVFQPKRLGPVNERIEVRLDDERSSATVIPVRGSVAAPVQVSPNPLVLPRQSDAGPIFEGRCVCRSTQGKPIKVRVESIPEGLSVKAEPHESNPRVCFVRVECLPSLMLPTSQHGELTVSLKVWVGDTASILPIRVMYQRERSPQ